MYKAGKLPDKKILTSVSTTKISYKVASLESLLEGSVFSFRNFDYIISSGKSM